MTGYSNIQQFKGRKPMPLLRTSSPLRDRAVARNKTKQKNLNEIQKTATLIRTGCHKNRNNMKKTFLEEKKCNCQNKTPYEDSN